MQAKREIWFRKFCVKAIRQHRARAADCFFRRLSDEQNRAVPLIFHFRERLRRAEKNRHVNVVTARVHDVNLFAFVILRHDFARVGQTGFLLDRQRIEIGAHQHGRPGAVLHHADHAVTFQSRILDTSRSFPSPRSRPLSKPSPRSRRFVVRAWITPDWYADPCK